MTSKTTPKSLDDQLAELEAEAQARADELRAHKDRRAEARRSAEYAKACAIDDSNNQDKAKAQDVEARLNALISSEEPPTLEEVWQTYLELRLLHRKAEKVRAMVNGYRQATEGIRRSSIGVEVGHPTLGDPWRDSRWTDIVDRIVESRTEQRGTLAADMARLDIVTAGETAETAYDKENLR